jgi:N-acetyltransferase
MLRNEPADVTPVTLEGRLVRLVPLAHQHRDDLIAAVRDGELWKLWYTSVPEPEQMDAEIERRLAQQAAGTMIPLTVIDAASGRAVGMTTYMNIDRINRRVEIGSTWYARSFQRTGLNTEAKLLLLTHAFDTLNCIAVEFRTHIRNEQSRNAIERLGAKFDGILRNHSYAKDGTLRDTCVYSIIPAEWPAVRARLESFLAMR